MMTNVIIGIVGLMVLSAAFFIGYFMGVTNAFEMAERLDDDAVDYDDLYCSNCGIAHSGDCAYGL